MTRSTSDSHVVLRGTIFVAGAVRVPRSPSLMLPRDRSAAPPQGLPVTAAPDQARQDELETGREEGLRSGREEGRRAGYAEGLREGEAVAREQARAAVEAAVLEATRPLEERARGLAALLAGLAEAANSVRDGIEEDIAVLCYQVLCRVVGEAALTPQGVRRQVERLVAATESNGAITLRLHPSDVPLIEEAAQAGGLATGADCLLRLIADPRIVLGGCIVAVPGGGLDARLETVLEECKAGLLRARRAVGVPA